MYAPNTVKPQSELPPEQWELSSNRAQPKEYSNDVN